MTIPIPPATTRRATRAAALIAAVMMGTAVATAGATTGPLGTTSSPTPTTTTTPTGPVVTQAAVDALAGSLKGDTAKLAAIGTYVNAKQAVVADQAVVAHASAGAIQTVAASQAAAAGAAARAVQAMTAEQAAVSGAEAARADLERRRHSLSSLAVALYVRDDVGVTGRPADPSAAGPDRTIMLVVLLAHEKDDIRAARRQVADAQQAVRRATARAGQADAAAATANAALALARAGQAQAVATAKAGLARATAALAGARARAMLPASPASPSSVARSSPPSSVSLPGPTGSADQRGPPILGPPSLTGRELAGWFATTGYQPVTTVPLATLARYYIDAGKAEGVMGDIAFAQSILETGYFTFPSPGQLAGTDNNFAGIGACDTCAQGWGFPDAETGVRAQMQLLHAYAPTQHVTTPLVGDVGVAGCCPTWMALTGVWATSSTYGFAILSIYQKMVEWAIPLRAAAAGL